MKTTHDPEMLVAIKAAPMFSALSDHAVARLLAGATRLTRAAGMQLFSPAQEADRFFIVLTGRIKVFQLSPRGDEQILHLFDPGATVGEAAMFSGRHFPAFAEAVTDATVAAISRKKLVELLHEDTDLVLGMLAGMSAKLREFAGLIEQLSLKEVPARLAAALLRQSDGGRLRRVKLTQTKRQLAAQIGTVAETLSRALARMKADGLVDVRGSEIELLDVDGLRRLVEAP